MAKLNLGETKETSKVTVHFPNSIHRLIFHRYAINLIIVLTNMFGKRLYRAHWTQNTQKILQL